MGLQSIKNAGKGIKNVAVGVSEEALEQAGKQVITSGKTIGEGLVQTGANLEALTFKQPIVAIGEAGTREVLNNAMDGLSHFALEQFKPQISATIQNKVNGKFCQSNLMSLIRKFYALDSMSNNVKLAKHIENVTHENSMKNRLGAFDFGTCHNTQNLKGKIDKMRSFMG